MVTIERRSKPGQPYESDCGTIPLADVARKERPLPDEYIAPGGMDVTRKFLGYIEPLIGELPEYASLTIKRAKS
jgi:6-phosphofructokinase 1